MNQKLSLRTFIISQIVILLLGLIFAGGLYFSLNYQPGQKNNISSLGLGGPVTKEPATLTLDLENPDDDLLTFQDSLEISGKTSPLSQILISSDLDDQAIESKADGSFSADFTLDPGVNNLKIIVFDKNGNMREALRSVYYSKEKI